MAALNADGKVVAVNDEVTIMGSVNSITGTGGGAFVTVVPNMGTTTINCNANDMNAVQHDPGTTPTVTSISGKAFGVGDKVSVLGTVTGTSGSGQFAVLTVTLCNSGNSVQVPAGSVHSLQFNG
jgi:hypothetical protein